MLKETRAIDNMKVRSLCIKKRYYTRGTVKEYDNLLLDLCKGEADIEKIEIIANDIFEHSDIESIKHLYGCDDNEVIENIAFELINDCCYTTIETINPR